MKRKVLDLLFFLVGVAAGYIIAYALGLKGWNMFLEMLFGGGLGLFVGMAFREKQYGVLVGAVIGLITSASLDTLAGSSIVIRDKLGDMFFGSFIGWYFPIYLRQMLIGGVVGGILGFVWGMVHSHRIGNTGFAPGDGAILLAILWFILGMGVGKLYMVVYGYQYIKNTNRND